MFQKCLFTQYTVYKIETKTHESDTFPVCPVPTDTLLPEFDHGRELGSFPWQIVVCTLHIVPREDALGLVVGKNTGGYDSLAPGNKLKGHAQASLDGDLPVHVVDLMHVVGVTSLSTVTQGDILPRLKAICYFVEGY